MTSVLHLSPTQTKTLQTWCLYLLERASLQIQVSLYLVTYLQHLIFHPPVTTFVHSLDLHFCSHLLMSRLLYNLLFLKSIPFPHHLALSCSMKLSPFFLMVLISNKSFLVHTMLYVTPAWWTSAAIFSQLSSLFLLKLPSSPFSAFCVPLPPLLFSAPASP